MYSCVTRVGLLVCYILCVLLVCDLCVTCVVRVSYLFALLLPYVFDTCSLRVFLCFTLALLVCYVCVTRVIHVCYLCVS